MANVRFESITKVYPGGVQAVREVTLTVQDRELMVLVGPSGCGKSTLLRMAAGLEEITSGRLYINDRLVNDVPPKDRDIAMVFQSYALYPHMSVRENMGFGLKLRKIPREEIRTRVETAGELLGLTQALDRRPKALSGGQRQRVALGRAIVRQPEVFLFDEPLSNLDASLRVQMRTEINKLHHDLDATMIYVTHDQVEAMTMADRIAVLRDGLLQQVDEPLTLYNHPVNRFVASFIGSPAMNFLDGNLDGDVFSAPGLRLPLSGRLAPLTGTRGPVTLGIRPENVDLVTGSEGAGVVAGTARIVEPMGNEIFLHMDLPTGPLLARIGPEVVPRVGEPYRLRLQGEHAHLFSREDERSLLASQPSGAEAGV